MPIIGKMQIVCASWNEVLIVVIFIIIIFTTYSKPIGSEEAKIPISRSQTINDNDPDRGLEFCEELMYAVMTGDNPNFLNNIIFSESQFLLEWIWYVISPQLKVLIAGKSSLDSRVPHSTQRQIKRMGGNHRTAFCRTLLF
jgi:hypothetical protein